MSDLVFNLARFSADLRDHGFSAAGGTAFVLRSCCGDVELTVQCTKHEHPTQIGMTLRCPRLKLRAYLVQHETPSGAPCWAIDTDEEFYDLALDHGLAHSDSVTWKSLIDLGVALAEIAEAELKKANRIQRHVCHHAGRCFFVYATERSYRDHLSFTDDIPDLPNIELQLNDSEHACTLMIERSEFSGSRAELEPMLLLWMMRDHGVETFDPGICEDHYLGWVLTAEQTGMPIESDTIHSTRNHAADRARIMNKSFGCTEGIELVVVEPVAQSKYTENLMLADSEFSIVEPSDF